MRRTYSGGGVVLDKRGKVLVVNQKSRAWSLPKGHAEPGENILEAAKREIYEETGVSQLTFLEELGTYERPKLSSENKDDQEELKVITIFLFKTAQEKLEPHDKENPEARWVDVDEVEKILTHPKDKAFFKKIKARVKKTIDKREHI